MELSHFELDVMQLFWSHGELSAPQAHKLIEETKAISYSTAKTIIDRLEKKGAIERSAQQGRTIFYRPLVEREQHRKPLIKDFIKRVFLGKSKPLAAHILEEEELSMDDIEYLESVLEKRKKDLK